MSAALVLSGTLQADGYGAKAMYITLLAGMVLMLVNWIKDGVLSDPAAAAMTGVFGATGVIYGQALAGGMMGRAQQLGAGSM